MNTPTFACPDAWLAALSPAAFAEPTWYAPSTWVQHAPFLFWLIETQRPRNFVELGSHFGYSFFAACQQVSASGLDTQCTAIDTWSGDEHAGYYSDSVFGHVSKHAAAHYAGFASLKRMTFDAALADVAPGSIDLLHIDGRHFYDDVKHDFESWLPKVATQGIVLFHDTQVRERGFGVHQLWSEIARAYPSFEFRHGHGLGVIAVGGVPRSMAPFFALVKDDVAVANVRAAYERLGHGLEAPAKAGRHAFKSGFGARARRALARLTP